MPKIPLGHNGQQKREMTKEKGGVVTIEKAAIRVMRAMTSRRAREMCEKEQKARVDAAREPRILRMLLARAAKGRRGAGFSSPAGRVSNSNNGLADDD